MLWCTVAGIGSGLPMTPETPNPRPWPRRAKGEETVTILVKPKKFPYAYFKAQIYTIFLLYMDPLVRLSLAGGESETLQFTPGQCAGLKLVFIRPLRKTPKGQCSYMVYTWP